METSGSLSRCKPGNDQCGRSFSLSPSPQVLALIRNQRFIRQSVSHSVFQNQRD
jgi:hypothetical protein